MREAVDGQTFFKGRLRGRRRTTTCSSIETTTAGGTACRSASSRGRIWKWSSRWQVCSNPLQQTIEALAKEKGIEPDVVISAIEEAVATASRKYYKTGENLKTRFNPRPARSTCSR